MRIYETHQTSGNDLMRQRIIGIALTFALLSGCSNNDFEPFAAPNKRAASFESQIASALSLNTSVERDDALGLVALDAANVGDVHWAKQAIRQISDWEARDDSAIFVAGRLKKGGKADAAVEVAEMISSSVVRSETLKLLTKAN